MEAVLVDTQRAYENWQRAGHTDEELAQMWGFQTDKALATAVAIRCELKSRGLN